jgi:c-di-GMP-binding flagellar brake protein YcgR
MSTQGTYPTTQPTPLAALTGRAIDEFRVTNHHELLALLRRLVDSAALVQLSGPTGAAYTSTLWSLDPKARRISLDVDPAHPQVRPLVDAGEATAVAYLDAVKLQFDLPGLMLVHGYRASALQAVLPTAVYRFQRREHFRVRAREGSVAHVVHPLSQQVLTLRVLDVSVGGCSLAVPKDMTALPPSSRIEDVRFELDADTLFSASLTLQHVSDGSGSSMPRIGCAFDGLQPASQRALQRYVDLTQRRQKFMLL